MEADLLSILACPKCRADLTLSSDEKGLICESCRLIYPVRNGVPVMILEEAVPLQEKGMAAQISFLVVEGKNKGEKIELQRGECRALGRSLDDVERTRVFSVDSAASLDDSAKKLVIQYVTRQFRKGAAVYPSHSERGLTGEEIGGFRRGPDFRLRDLAVSRLHAMLFYDESGGVGVLDLVSRNGTFVNGAEVESKVLKQGDLVAVGGTKIRYEASSP